MNAVFLVKAVFVFAVKHLDAYGADDALGFPLLLLHVVEDDVFFDFLAVLAERGAFGAEVGEKLGAVVVELLAEDVGDAVVDVAGGNVAGFFAVFFFPKFFNDEDLVDEVLDDAILEGFDLLVELLFVAGVALDLRDERRDFAADVIDGDDFLLGDGGDAVGKAHVQPIVLG